MDVKKEYLKLNNSFKNHYQLILIIPTILGGLWQILELSKISTSYIRFFSVTQIIPDGLLILFFLTIIYISYKIAVLSKGMHAKSNEIKSNKVKAKKSSLWFNIISLLIFVIAIFFFVKTFYTPYNGRISLLTLAIIIPAFIILISALIIIFKNIYQHIKIEFPKTSIKFGNFIKKPFITRIIAFIALYLLLHSFFFGLSLLSDFSNSYSFPENSNNIENLKKMLKNEYPNDESKILYINDKYVFIELENESGNKKNLIIEFNKLFFTKKNNLKEFKKDKKQLIENETKISDTIPIK